MTRIFLILLTSTGVLVAALHCSEPRLIAQSAGSAAPAEAAAVARGWALLAQGNAAAASKAAMELVAKYPRSAAVLVLGVDAAIANGGAMSGLDVYERWLGRRAVEDGHVLRRIAHALLREAARGDSDRGRRVEAVEALQRDGDPDAAALMRGPEGSAAGGAGGRAKGEGIDDTLAALKFPGPPRRTALAALAKTGDPRAVPAILEILSDPDPMVRAAAADALGAAKAVEAVPQLRALLQDPVVGVRFSAADALLAMGDYSGVPSLRELLGSEHAGVRVAAARALNAVGGPEWLNVVRALTKAEGAEIRREAAELVAPHDPELARATLEPLLNDANPAQRQAALKSYVRYVTTDFAVLRRYFRASDAGTRIHAADRVLELTR